MSTRLKIVRPAYLALFGLCSFFCLVALPAVAAEPAASRVTRVTLYQGQALVTRTVPVEGAKGALEIVVSNLPEQVIPTTLYAEGSEGVEVRAVRFRSQAVGQEPREEVRKIDAAINDLNEKLQANKKGQEVLASAPPISTNWRTSRLRHPRPTWPAAFLTPRPCRSCRSSLSSSGRQRPRSLGPGEGSQAAQRESRPFRAVRARS